MNPLTIDNSSRIEAYASPYLNRALASYISELLQAYSISTAVFIERKEDSADTYTALVGVFTGDASRDLNTLLDKLPSLSGNVPIQTSGLTVYPIQTFNAVQHFLIVEKDERIEKKQFKEYINILCARTSELLEYYYITDRLFDKEIVSNVTEAFGIFFHDNINLISQLGMTRLLAQTYLKESNYKELSRSLDTIDELTDTVRHNFRDMQSTYRFGYGFKKIEKVAELVARFAAVFKKREGLSFTSSIPQALSGQSVSGVVIPVLCTMCSNTVQAFRKEHPERPRRRSPRLELRFSTSSLPGMITITLVDNGPGIPASIAHRIFEPTFTTKTRGTGLGLYLALRIIRSMGGELVLIQSAYGMGASFELTVPRKQNDEAG